MDLVLDQPEPSLDGDPTPARPAHRALDINLVGVYLSTYLALHYFRLPAKSGKQDFKKSLVLISSLTGYMDLPYVLPDITSTTTIIEGMLMAVQLQHRLRNLKVRHPRHVQEHPQSHRQSQRSRKQHRSGLRTHTIDEEGPPDRRSVAPEQSHGLCLAVDAARVCGRCMWTVCGRRGN